MLVLTAREKPPNLEICPKRVGAAQHVSNNWVPQSVLMGHLRAFCNEKHMKKTERDRGVEFFKSFLVEGIEYLTGISLKMKPHFSRNNCKEQICKHSSRWP